MYSMRHGCWINIYIYIYIYIHLHASPSSLPSIHSIPSTAGFVPTITEFGVYGDGIERVTRSTYHRGFNVLCGSSAQDITIYWHYMNGSRIGIKNRSFREGHFENGIVIATSSIPLSASLFYQPFLLPFVSTSPVFYLPHTSQIIGGV